MAHHIERVESRRQNKSQSDLPPIPSSVTFGPRPIRMDMFRNLFRPAKIVIAGHSFVTHLDKYMDDYFGPRNNMGLSYNSASVLWMGRGGHTIASFREEELSKLKSAKADIIHLELGTNDLADGKDPLSLSSEMESLVSELLESGVHFVAVGQIIPRNDPQDPWWIRHHPLPPDFNEKVPLYNKFLKQMLAPCCHEKALYWRHRGFWNPSVAVLEEGDGVHPNDYGSYTFYRSVRGSLVHGLKRIQDALKV